jgi:hypothetical protein
MDADEIREAIAHKQELIGIHKRNLCKFEKQAALCGMIVPVSVLNEIEYAQSQIIALVQEIAELKYTLSKLKTDLLSQFYDPLRQITEAYKQPSRETCLIAGSYFRQTTIHEVKDVDMLVFPHHGSSSFCL